MDFMQKTCYRWHIAAKLNAVLQFANSSVTLDLLQNQLYRRLFSITYLIEINLCWHKYCIFCTFQFQMPGFIWYAPLKQWREDILHYNNDFGFDNQQQIKSSNEKKFNQLSNAVLSHICKTVLIHFQLCYWKLLIDPDLEKTEQTWHWKHQHFLKIAFFNLGAEISS